MISVVLDRWQKQTMFLWSNLNHHFEALSLIMPFYWDLGAPYSLQPSKINQTQQFYEFLWFSIKWFQSTVISVVFFDDDLWRHGSPVPYVWIQVDTNDLGSCSPKTCQEPAASMEEDAAGQPEAWEPGIWTFKLQKDIYILGFLAFCSNRVSNVIS